MSAGEPRAQAPTQALGLKSVLRLLVALRFRLASRRLAPRGALLGATFSALLALTLALAAGWGSYRLFAGPLARGGPIWLDFGLALFSFLLGLFWLLWPVVAAQIDEAYELSRYFVYPVRPRTLYLAQTLIALVEPATLLFAAPLVGMVIGLGAARGLPLAPGLLLLLGYTLLCLAGGRLLANLLLGVLSSRRSGELLLGAVLALLLLSFLLPPVDASWLTRRLGGFGANPADLRLLSRATLSMRQTPFGWLAVGLDAVRYGAALSAFVALAKLLALAALCWFFGLRALERFYRGGGARFWQRGRQRGSQAQPTPQAATKPVHAAPPAHTAPTHERDASPRPLRALLAKEVRLLAANPKARLLFFMPFFLLILLKIVGAPSLLAYLLGPSWAASLLTLVALYLLSVLAGQFLVNGLGYEGAGLWQHFLGPQPPWRWLVARNAAQALFATLQLLGVATLIFAGLPGASFKGLLLPLCAFALLLGLALGAGNLLSLLYPKRFTASLARRDRPAAASFLFMLVALGAGSATVYGLRLLAIYSGGDAPILALPVIGIFLYLASLPTALGLQRQRKHQLLEAIARRDA